MNYFATDKILKYPERIKEWLDQGWTEPITWEIDLTNRCNHKCPRCSGGSVGEEDMPLPLALKAIDELTGLGAKGLTFTGGGEPLLHPQFELIFGHALNSELDVALITNGTAVTQEIAELVSESAWVRVSLDACDTEGFARSHGLKGTAFHKVLENIQLLAGHKRKSTLGVGYLLGSPILPDELYRACKLVKSLGADYIQFRPYHREPVFFPPNLLLILREEFNKDGFTVQTTKFDIGPRRSYRECYGIEFCGVITATGELTLCCHTRGMPQFNFGNLVKESLRKIWLGEERKQAKALIDLEACIPLCRCDPFNRILWAIRQENPHRSFL